VIRAARCIATAGPCFSLAACVIPHFGTHDQAHFSASDEGSIRTNPCLDREIFTLFRLL
jgi:hypothetical protein